jgi:hypothetical protein
MRSKKLLLSSIAILLLSAGVIFAYNRLSKDTTPLVSETTKQQNNQETINNNPATEEEKKESESIKSNPETSIPEPTKVKDGRINATITITDASSSVVGAFASGVVEDGGICTSTFTQGTRSFTKNTNAIANVSYSQCGRVFLQPSDFPSKGQWTVVVKYESSAATGYSEVRQFNVE